MNIHVSRTKPVSKESKSHWWSCWAGGGLRWLSFWTLISAGLFGAMLGQKFIVGFGSAIGTLVGLSPARFFLWIPWVVFGVIWIPAAFRLSKRFAVYLDRFLNKSSISSPKISFKDLEQCSKCQEYVERNQALCPHCYEDLLTNCSDCGKQIDANSNICKECSKQSRTRIKFTSNTR